MNCRNLLISLLLLLFSTLTGYSQSSKKNGIGISMGISDLHLLDKHASPLIFKNAGISPYIDFYHSSGRNLHLLEVAYFQNYLNSNQENFNTENFSGKLRYTFLHQIFPEFEKARIFFGGSLNSFISISDFRFSYTPETYAIAISSWYLSHSADFSCRIEYPVLKNTWISGQLFLPFVSNVSRPNFSPGTDYNHSTNSWNINLWGKTVFFNKNFPVYTWLSINKIILKNFEISLAYDFLFANYKEPQQILIYQNTFRAGLLYSF